MATHERKHTPGPWGILREPDTPEEPGETRIAVDSGRKHIAKVCGWRMDSDDPEHSANARLIASAPELLEALEDARDRLARIAALHQNGGDQTTYNTAYYGKQDAAIRKARGE